MAPRGVQKVRLDELLLARGLAESRTRARALVLAGQVVVGENRVDKPGTRVPADSPLRVKGPAHPFVSRGGLKLQAALDAFRLDPAGLRGLDVGASTGGFTDCLLARGAAEVIALDVGRGQLHPRLRGDPRVRVLERFNVRALEPRHLPGPVDFAVADLSFISLGLALPPVLACLRPGAWLVLLVKPQFEVGRGRVGKGGIVRDEAARLEALEGVAARARALGLAEVGRITSPITGADGNVEYLLGLRWPG